MVFSSVLFLCCFLPVFLIIYYILPYKYRNVFTLIASLIFYAWGAPKFVFVILSTTFIDFHLVRFMSKNNNVLHRRLLLTLSVSINVGLLFYFKYSNFFIENVNAVLSVFGDKNIIWTKLVLPIGISFYTFETITYVVDVYRRIHKPLDNFWDYQLYIILFPKLIAGPIIRYHDLAHQIIDRRSNENIDNRLSGLFRFVIGLSKKVLIANVLGKEADAIFAMNTIDLSSSTAWIGILAYTFQIYFDFSGYSDMAIGIGRMIGFDFLENFNNPYISRNITEFWRRWHISLGRWMKDYLYIPLGGNKVKNYRLYFNLWFVFIISGFWHGASWNFIIWGAYHGVFLIFDRLFLIKVYKTIGKSPSIAITFFITVIGWVIFRTNDMHQAYNYIYAMFKFDFSYISFYSNTKFYFVLLIAIILCFYGSIDVVEKWQLRLYEKKQSNIILITMVVFAVIFYIIDISAVTANGFNPFIYFRF